MIAYIEILKFISWFVCLWEDQKWEIKKQLVCDEKLQEYFLVERLFFVLKGFSLWKAGWGGGGGMG